MRALLIVNPAATSTTEATREVITAALAGDFKLDVTTTTHRGHARELAAEAAAEQLDAVVVLGGDGTVNEVVNGLLRAGPAPEVPSLAVVPGGSTNVLARSLGLPRDPVDATATLLDAARTGRRRSISLGRADERWFTFCAGLGFDAGVVARVERHRDHGRRATGGRYVRAAIAEYLRSAGRAGGAPMTVTLPGADPVDVHLALVTNTAPWTYLGHRTVDPSPHATFETGLDAYALTGLGLLPTLWQVRRILSGQALPPKGRQVLAAHDVDELVLRATGPALPLQVDGDYLGRRDQVHLRVCRRALTVLV